jgi:hypothetical protein
VKLLQAIIAGLLLVAWVPATSHPLLEHLGLIHQAHASGDSDTDQNHDGADGLCVLPGVGGPLVKGMLTHELPVAAIAVIFVISPQISKDMTGASGLGPSPPLLPKSWQFLLRTAPPSRAPSIA